MKNHEANDSSIDTTQAGERQSRREFLNGLGKWSMIIIAAVSSVRGSVFQSYLGAEEAARPEWGLPEAPMQRLARKKHRQHVDIAPGHINFPHGDVPHVDTKIQQREGGGVSPVGRPPKTTR
jgi:hypothetical protein